MGNKFERASSQLHFFRLFLPDIHTATGTKKNFEKMFLVLLLLFFLFESELLLQIKHSHTDNITLSGTKVGKKKDKKEQQQQKKISVVCAFFFPPKGKKKRQQSPTNRNKL